MAATSTTAAKRKQPAELAKSSVSANADIVDFLNDLANFEKNVERNMNKHNVYRRAARSVAAYPTRLTSGKEAQKLEGVGVKIGAKIDEFLTTGKLKKLEKIKADPKAELIQKFTFIVGFGPAAARKYVDKGINTMEELAKQSDLTNMQRIGLKHMADFAERIPRVEMEALRDEALKYVKEIDAKLEGEVCGSFRRGASSSGDVDLLLTHPDYHSESTDGTSPKKKPKKDKHDPFSLLLTKIVDRMKAANFVTDVLSCGETKFMGVCRLHQEGAKFRRIDIRLWPKDQYPLALFYFTGSDEFAKEIRRKAIEKKFRLNEYSLCPLNEDGTPSAPLPITSEQDIFDYLDETFVAPQDR